MKNVILSTRDIDEFVCDVANEVIRKIDLWYGTDTLRHDKMSKEHFTKRGAETKLSCNVHIIDKLIQQGHLNKIKIGVKVLNTHESQARNLTNKKGRNSLNNKIKPLKTTSNVAIKDSRLQAQFQIVFNGFLKSPYTMKELSIITGIDRANICRYVRILRLAGKIAVYKKGYCSITKHKANLYTTNPKFMTISKQLKLF
ncbi:MAG TPA: hypothetical protein VK169_15280 [Saprospiraceae bacterium]|nr:hypothetical protein [Saprospiraceae bacterium]